MRATFFVDSQKDFDAWFKMQGGSTASASAGPAIALTGGDAAAGQAMFASKCAACHSTGAFAQKLVGPGLGKIFNDPDHAKLVNGTAPTPEDAAAILENGYTGDLGQMPDANTNGLTDKDIANLVAYLVSLSKK